MVLGQVKLPETATFRRDNGEHYPLQFLAAGATRAVYTTEVSPTVVCNIEVCPQTPSELENWANWKRKANEHEMKIMGHPRAKAVSLEFMEAIRRRLSHATPSTPSAATPSAAIRPRGWRTTHTPAAAPTPAATFTPSAAIRPCGWRTTHAFANERQRGANGDQHQVRRRRPSGPRIFAGHGGLGPVQQNHALLGVDGKADDS